MFFDPQDLIKVANGEIEEDDPKPYCILDLGNYFYDNREVGSIAFDRENGFLYVREQPEYGKKLPIHVFKIKQ